MQAPDELAWMRDPARGPRLLDHLRTERDHYLRETARLAPFRDSIAAATSRYLSDGESGPSWRVDDVRYWWEHPPSAEYPVLRRDGGAGAEDLVDLSVLAGGSPYVRLGLCEVSPDNEHLAYGVDVLGDESYELRFRRLTGGDDDRGDLDETIPSVYYGGAWSADGTTFFYVIHDSAFRPWTVRAHRLGTSPADDRVVVAETDAQFHITTRATPEWLVVSASSRITSQEWVVDLRDAGAEAVEVSARRVGRTYHATPVSAGGRDSLLIVTNDGATDFRLMHAERPGTDVDDWAELLGEIPGRRLHHATMEGDRVVVESRRDGPVRLLAFPWGRPEELLEIGPGVPDGALQRVAYESPQSGSVTVEIESYLDPPRVEAVDLEAGARSTVWARAAGAYRRERYTSERRAVTARDGTAIPVTVVRRTDVPLDGSAPCLLYGYGAWETVIEPAFDPALIALLDLGVVYAHAHLRGGGEGGRRWWEQGHLAHKETTFTDFIDVAESIGGAVVDADRIVARGRSAGGLLMGAVYSLRPELWRGIVAEVPFVDPITTMRDPDAPLVAVEWDEWGDPRREEDLAWMSRWSPFDNPPPADRRPALLATGVLNDSRVSIWEPARWVARLRSSGSDISGTLLRPELGPGAHAVPHGRTAQVAYLAEIYAWVADRLGVAPPAPRPE